MGIQLSTWLWRHQRGEWGTSLHSSHSTCLPLGGVEAQVLLDPLTPKMERKWHVDQYYLEPTCFASERGQKFSPPHPHRAPWTLPWQVGKVVCQQELLHSPSSCLLPLPRGRSSVPSRALPIPGLREQKATIVPAVCCSWVKMQVQLPTESGVSTNNTSYHLILPFSCRMGMEVQLFFGPLTPTQWKKRGAIS